MRAFWRPIATILLIAASTIFLTVPTPAAADTPFAPVFSTNAPGDIKFVSNTVATCSNAFANCAAAQSGAAWNNNNVSGNMILVDIDGDPTTPTSSSATYTLPPGGSVLWAGLYWSGYYEGPNGDKDDIRFETPTSGGYTNLTADQLYTSAVSDDFYGGFVDVTAAVAAGGSGTYTVGDISVTPNFFSDPWWVDACCCRVRPGRAVEKLDGQPRLPNYRLDAVGNYSDHRVHCPSQRSRQRRHWCCGQ